MDTVDEYVQVTPDNMTSKYEKVQEFLQQGKTDHAIEVLEDYSFLFGSIP